MYEDIKNYIQSIVRANGNEEITGTNMQQVLLQMVDIVGSPEFRGVASPGTNPGVPVGPAIYITAIPGTYISFGNLQVAQGELALLKWTGVVWQKQTIITVVSDIFVRNMKGVPFVEELIKLKGNQETVVTTLAKANGFVVVGIVSWAGVGLTFNISYNFYFLNNLSFEIQAGQVTLDPADPNFDRFDVIALTDIPDYAILKGIASAQPIKPQVNAYQLELTYILVKAGAATPEIQELIIYDENTESVGSAEIMHADFNDLAFPYHLTKAVNCSDIDDNAKLIFTLAAPEELSSYNTLGFCIRLKSVMPTAGKIFAQFFINGETASDEIPLTIINTIVDQYQFIGASLSAFKFTSDSFDKIVFRYSGFMFSGFYFDYLRLEGGIVQPAPEGWYFDVVTPNGLTRQLIRPGDNAFFQPRAGSRIKLLRSSHFTNGNVLEIDFDETNLHANLIDDLNFDFRDIEAKAMTYVLILKAAFAFEIVSLWAVCDAATSINGVTVKINGTAVKGISNVTVTTTPGESTASDHYTVAAGDTVTLTATGITGTPTELVGTIKRRRL